MNDKRDFYGQISGVQKKNIRRKQKKMFFFLTDYLHHNCLSGWLQKLYKSCNLFVSKSKTEIALIFCMKVKWLNKNSIRYNKTQLPFLLSGQIVFFFISASHMIKKFCSQLKNTIKKIKIKNSKSGKNEIKKKLNMTKKLNEKNWLNKLKWKSFCRITKCRSMLQTPIVLRGINSSSRGQ